MNSSIKDKKTPSTNPKPKFYEEPSREEGARVVWKEVRDTKFFFKQTNKDIIIDMGSHTIKAGFYGEKAPRTEF